MAELALAQHHPPISHGEDGVVRVGGTRVTLDSIVGAFTDGATAEEIAQQYPAVHLADIYATISYYLRETEQIEAYLGQRAELSARVRERNRQRFDATGIRDRLMARRG